MLRRPDAHAHTSAPSSAAGPGAGAPGRTTAPAPTVLLTGFDAFGGDSLNPSWLLAQALDGLTVAGHRVVAACLPTVFGESLDMLAQLLQRHAPALVVCLGQAGGRAALSLERVAINVEDARIADNRGAQPVDRPVVRDGPAAYFTSLPIKAMLQAVRDAGVPAEVSQTAGTFVCNHVFYGLMHRLAVDPALRHTRGGFIHVPWLPEQGRPAMALQDMHTAVRAALGAALATDADLALAGGAEH